MYNAMYVGWMLKKSEGLKLYLVISQNIVFVSLFYEYNEEG